MGLRVILVCACLVAARDPVTAADLTRADAGPPVLFRPTNPVGVASEVPRSPLTDIVTADARFASPDAAQRHCPFDVVVWVPFGSNVYRLDRRQPDGPHELGAFLCQADASLEGDRPRSGNRAAPN